MVLCLFVCSAIGYSASPKAKKKEKTEKKVDERIYLEHADNLRFDMYGQNAGAQIATGNVSFIHKGTRLWCDSAYFYQQSEVFKAFGHVRMTQADTLSLTSDYAWYDGNVGREILYASQNVVLKHKTSTLYTDSLVYDRLWNFAYFLNGGKMVDKGNELVSEWGEYHTDTRVASFLFGVHLKGRDGLRLHTDTLHYNSNRDLAHAVGPTQVIKGKTTIDTNDGYFDNNTSIAHLVGPSTIVNDGSVVTTTDGYFNTSSDESKLYQRSKVVNGDRTIEADTLINNDETGESEGYGNVVYEDQKNQNQLFCGYFKYNDKTGEGFATIEPLLKEYSQKDTLFTHADTIRLETFNIDTDSVYRKVHAYPHARAYRTDVQAVADSIVGCSQDSSMTMYRDPIVWHGEQQLLGEVIQVFMRDSLIDRAHVINQAFSIEKLQRDAESETNSKAVDHYNQLSSKEMWAYFTDGKLRMSEAISNVVSDYFLQDDADSTLIAMNYNETDTLRMYIDNGQLGKIWTSKGSGHIYPMNQIPADKRFLPGFAWFDYIRPRDKYDLFEWRPKKEGTQLKNLKRTEAPRNKLQ